QSRQLYTELEKLKLYQMATQKAIDGAAIDQLVTTSTQSSLQLATAIRQGDTPRALGLIDDLFRQNEAPLRIVATLVTQFRLWLWLKLMIESGERDERAIAKAAEIANPKRIYFLQQEVRTMRLDRLLQTLPLLLDLEFGLKRGAEPVALMQTKAIELCALFDRP
ncbi:MAG: DNA polymerase III subunit delta, partial [Leptolyngbyaceae cyanobacterium SM1_3_5]|nr:DNA polymerase III subunit delta [Leptolyngbyaceae cyanobacterium SM1_3_5]